MGRATIHFLRIALCFVALLLSAQALSYFLPPGELVVQAQESGQNNPSLPLIFNDLKPANEIINNENNVEFWEFFRGLINYVLVAALIVVAFANVLRLNLDTYSVKKALPSLILGFVLANFSLFICQAILDLAQSLSVTALDTAEAALGVDVGAAMFGGGFGTVLASVIALIIPAIAIGGPFGLIVGAIVAILLLFFPILVMIGFLVLFLVRNLVLQFLVVVAPLAFIAMGIPGTQGWFSKWWSQFTLWAFMKPVAYALLVFGALIIEAEIGGDIVAYIVGILVMAAAIYVPLNSGKLVFSPLMKYGGGFLAGRVQSGFNRIMARDFSGGGRANAAGRVAQNLLGRTVFGLQAIKQEEERRGRLARSRGMGEAMNALRTRASVGRQFGAGRYPVRSALAYLGFASPEWAGVRRTTHFRNFATAQEEAERAKELPDDPYSLMEVAAFTNDPIDKSIALNKLADKGMIKAYLDSYKGLIDNASGPVKDQLQLQAALLPGQGLNADETMRNSDLLQRFLAAQLGTLEEQKKIREKLSAGGPNMHQDAVSSISENHYAVEQMSKISEQLFQQGNFHLGSMAEMKAGAAPVLNTHSAGIPGVVTGRDEINISRALSENEPQKLTTGTSKHAVLHPTQADELSDFFKKLTSDRSFAAATAQLNRLKGPIQTAIRRQALTIPMGPDPQDPRGRQIPTQDMQGNALNFADPRDYAYAEFMLAARNLQA